MKVLSTNANNNIMKHLTKILIVLCLFCVQSICASVTSDVIAAFRSGYSEAITRNLADNIELVIDNSDNIYSSQQTGRILAHFFKENPPISFKIVHQGKQENSEFVIGTLKTQSKEYRIYFLLKNDTIQQLRIE